MKPTLEEAVECMIEGTNATGFCVGSWGRSSNPGECGGRLDFDTDEMYDNMEHVDLTCAEGAVIYGAWLRGYNQEFAWSLLHMLGAEYLHAYGASLNGENDRIGHSAANGDPRHGIIGKTKELL